MSFFKKLTIALTVLAAAVPVATALATASDAPAAIAAADTPWG